MRALHDTVNKASLDSDTIVRGLHGLMWVLQQSEGFLPKKPELSHAQAFIQNFNEYYPLTASMQEVQSRIDDSAAKNSTVRIPFDV